MRKAVWIIAVLLILSATSFAQGHYIGQAQNQFGAGVPSASIRVCTELAVGSPCTPLATIYSCVAMDGTCPLGNPFTSDQYGNFSFFANPGVPYHIQITGPSIGQYNISYVYIPSATASAPGGPTNAVQVNGPGFVGYGEFTYNHSIQTLSVPNVIVSTEITVPTPVNPTDAANKNYVDTHALNLSSPPPIGNVTPNTAVFSALTVIPAGSGTGVASIFQINSQAGPLTAIAYINMANGDTIGFENHSAAGANLLGQNSSDRVTWNNNQLAYNSELPNLSSPPPIGNLTPSTGKFTALQATVEAIVPTPVNAGDAATKLYVDSAVGANGTVIAGTVIGQFYETADTTPTANPSVNLVETALGSSAQLTYNGTGGASIAGPVQATLLSTTSYTVATLPASPTAGSQAWTTDGVSPSDCTVGLSSGNAHNCYFTGSIWIAGGGGSGTVNTGVTGAFGEYLSNSPTISSSPSLSEASNILTYTGSGGIRAAGGFQSASLTAGQLTLTRPSVANFLLSVGTIASSYGWYAPTADAAGVIRSPGGGTTSVPSQLTISPIATSDMISGINAQTGTTYTVLATDNAKFVTISNSGAIAVTLPHATTAGFGAGFFFSIKDTNTGTATITPTTSTIDGNASLALTTGQECTIWSDGANFFSGCGAGAAGSSTFQVNGVNLISSSTINFQNSISLAGGIVIGFTNPSGGVVKAGLISGGFQGNGTLFQTGCGSTTTNDLLAFDASGCAVDSGILKTAITALSSLTAAGSSHTIANGNNPQVWGWAQTTNSQSAFTINDTSAATGTSDILLNINTASGSTEFPIQITAGGAVNGVRMSTGGALSAIGIGSINANSCSGNLCLNATSLTVNNLPRVNSASTGVMSTSSITDNNTIAGTTENWFTAGIADVTNKLLVMQPIGVASAVDSLGVTNSATANPATITLAAQGSDTNIGLNLTTKGAGQVLCNGGDCGLASTAFLTVNQAAADPICNQTNLTPWTCAQVGLTKTYFATNGVIPLAATSGKIDGIHRGLTLTTQFDALWPGSSSGAQLTLNACSAYTFSTQTCTGAIALWSSTSATVAASSTLIGIPVNCTITVNPTTATTLITTCFAGSTIRFLPTTGSPVVTSVPNTGTNWVLVWSITYSTAAPIAEGVNLDSMVGSYIP